MLLLRLEPVATPHLWYSKRDMCELPNSRWCVRHDVTTDGCPSSYGHVAVRWSSVKQTTRYVTDWKIVAGANQQQWMEKFDSFTHLEMHSLIESKAFCRSENRLLHWNEQWCHKRRQAIIWHGQWRWQISPATENYKTSQWHLRCIQLACRFGCVHK